MRVLVACEFSAIVRDAFLARGPERLYSACERDGSGFFTAPTLDAVSRKLGELECKP